jgi:hypothetical protein
MCSILAVARGGRDCGSVGVATAGAAAVRRRREDTEDSQGE